MLSPYDYWKLTSPYEDRITPPDENDLADREYETSLEQETAADE